jgi:two-component system cell cycle sensor histidine kinase/response regulator CckA
VLLNLGINAAYAMRGRSGRITMHLGSTELGANAPALHRRLTPGHHVVVTVTDQGCGMAPATVARIFEPFFTTKPVGQGTGLGLSVVDGIIDTHGGGIVVQSAPGRGSTFSIYLRATAPEAERSAVAPAPAAAPTGSSGRHILYVDDQASLLPMIRSMIESLGYEVTTHADPSAALAAFRVDPGAFDAVVTDYKMPGMTGLDLARAVRGLRSDAPIALISGYAGGDFVDEARRVGIDEFIYKPSIADELGSVIERLLARTATRAPIADTPRLP